VLGSGKSSLEGNPFGNYAPLTSPVSSVTLSLSVRAMVAARQGRVDEGERLPREAE
jgi:hypothetical protein